VYLREVEKSPFSPWYKPGVFITQIDLLHVAHGTKSSCVILLLLLLLYTQKASVKLQLMKPIDLAREDVYKSIVSAHTQ